MKTVVTVSGIRPDFIRMSEIFKKLDNNFNHILIHSGQHFDKLLSDVFFEELDIRKPDYNLGIGGVGKEHFHQSSELSIKLIELLRYQKIDPDIILFLGDSNSVTVSVPLKKEGYKIGHIEAGMRSYDRRMLEEINRVVCDHCSDLLFVYHENYKNKAIKEGISEDNIFVVGNTIVEVVKKLNFDEISKRDRILLDIHRPENFNHKERLKTIVELGNRLSKSHGIPIKMLSFKRTMNKLKEFDIHLGNIEVVDLMSFKKYTKSVYHSKFIISDSGTAQEEPALLGTPVIVPRDYTERPESVENNCSIMFDVENNGWDVVEAWLYLNCYKSDTKWLGEGKTSDKIIQILKNRL
jgi:UDP-N-acetylglucosamine 2-epimerase (non-hydrolysing)